MTKVILDINGFTKMIDWPDDRLHHSIYVLNEPPVSPVNIRVADWDITDEPVTKRWRFRYDKSIERDIHIFKFEREE